MKNCLAVVFAAAVAAGGLSSFGEGVTWHWSPTDGAKWDNAKNWVNDAGERNVGYPKTGDIAIMGDKSNTQAMNPGGGSTTANPLQEIRAVGNSASTINQGNYVLRGGGQGFQYLAKQGGNSWSGMGFVGPGEIPINVAEANVTVPMQMRMLASNNPVVVKKGPGKFVCFNQADNCSSGKGGWNLPVLKIQAGTFDITRSGAIEDTDFYFDGEDASQRLSFCYASYSLDLTLKNCAIHETDVTSTAHGIEADKNRQVVFTGTPRANPMTFTGTFYNQAGLNWKPDSDDYTFVCSKAVSETKGTLTVSKGTVKLTDGASFTALAELAVAGGANLTVETGSGANFKAGALTIGEKTAKLNLGAGVALTVDAGTVSGIPLAPKTYGAKDGEGVVGAEWITGEGTVTVLTGPENAATWVGDAPEGPSVFVGGNWSSGSADLTDGSFQAAFASDGMTAALPVAETAKFNGLTLQNESRTGAFSFTAGDGAAAEIGANGIVAISSVASSWTMGWPLVIAADQTWNLGANDALTLTGGLVGDRSLVFDGSGLVTLAGAGTHSGALTLAGGSLKVTADGALGSSSRTFTFYNDLVNLSFDGTCTIDTPISGENHKDEKPGNGITIEPDADVTFNGKVYYKTQGRLTLGAGSTTTLKGGLGIGSSGMLSHLYLGGNGRLVVKNARITVNHHTEVSSGSMPTVELEVANNAFNSTSFWFDMRGRLVTRVANAFAGSTWLYLGANSVLDLDGHNESIDLLVGESTSKVTSASPATLTLASTGQGNNLHGGASGVDRAVYEGRVSIVKNGAQQHTFASLSTSTGSIAVANGTLTMAANGKWPNCESVTLNGGTLKLQNTQTFSSNAVWSVASSASVVLDNAGTNACEKLYVDGHRKGGGTYGAVGSGAKYEVNWITGNGLLDVAEHGLILFLR